MAIWPFNKKKLDQSMLPDEVSEYYKDEKVRTGRPAWVSGLLTVLFTALLAVVLFFGGRWIYQSIFGNNDESKETATTSEEKDETKGTQSDNQDDLTDPSDNTGPTQDDSNVTDSDDGEADQTPSSGAEPETTPSTGATEIPNTGPGPGGLQ